MTARHEWQPRVLYRFGDFILNLDQGALLAADGSEVALRPKSFAVLQLLVENSGRLMDRDTIMAAVWPGIHVTDESLAQCIRDVRRALGDTRQQIIRTLPKRGYRFEADVVTEEAQPSVSPTTSAGRLDDDHESLAPPRVLLAVLGDRTLNAQPGDAQAVRPCWMDTMDTWVTAHGGSLVSLSDRGQVISLPDARTAATAALDLAVLRSSDGNPAMAGLRAAVHAMRVGRHDGEGGGDAAMIALRLAEHAEPGSVLVSAEVARAIDGHVAAVRTDLGARRLSDLVTPLRVFRLTPLGSTPQRVPWVRPDPRPSIAVLPFRRDVMEADQAYLADGITEGIIHVLAGLEGLFVIARASTLGFRDTTLDPQAVGVELDVRYIVHGSIWRSKEQLRLGVELTDTGSGAVVFSKFYHGSTTDLFELQDRISFEVAANVVPHVQKRELQRGLRKHPGSMTAYDLVLQALDQIHRLRQESFTRGRLLLQRAIDEDPEFAPAYSYAAWWHILCIAQGWSQKQQVDSSEAKRLALAATERDQNDALALAVHGYVTAYAFRDYATALTLLARALTASPNCAFACLFNSVVHSWMGNGPQAVAEAERGLRLSPFDPFAFLHEGFLAMANYINNDYDMAVMWARSSDVRNPRHAPSLRALTVSLVALGRIEEARDAAVRILEIEPGFGLAAFQARTPLSGEIRDRYIERLREAGLPD